MPLFDQIHLKGMFQQNIKHFFEKFEKLYFSKKKWQ